MIRGTIGGGTLSGTEGGYCEIGRYGVEVGSTLASTSELSLEGSCGSMFSVGSFYLMLMLTKQGNAIIY